jgi:hypothetical protein
MITKMFPGGGARVISHITHRRHQWEPSPTRDSPTRGTGVNDHRETVNVP